MSKAIKAMILVVVLGAAIYSALAFRYKSWSPAAIYEGVYFDNVRYENAQRGPIRREKPPSSGFGWRCDEAIGSVAKAKAVLDSEDYLRADADGRLGYLHNFHEAELKVRVYCK